MGDTRPFEVVRWGEESSRLNIVSCRPRIPSFPVMDCRRGRETYVDGRHKATAYRKAGYEKDCDSSDSSRYHHDLSTNVPGHYYPVFARHPYSGLRYSAPCHAYRTQSGKVYSLHGFREESHRLPLLFSVVLSPSGLPPYLLLRK